MPAGHSSGSRGGFVLHGKDSDQAVRGEEGNRCERLRTAILSKKSPNKNQHLEFRLMVITGWRFLLAVRCGMEAEGEGGGEPGSRTRGHHNKKGDGTVHYGLLRGVCCKHWISSLSAGSPIASDLPGNDETEEHEPRWALVGRVVFRLVAVLGQNCSSSQSRARCGTRIPAAASLTIPIRTLYLVFKRRQFSSIKETRRRQR
ncbi:hypothetical protein QBC35DRAFT_79453 [Podospora australis]|uniref:Uncharacterized protein n=1 Tax=Podospora australis TaxID=1536484 RepID=A0AAN6WXS8_9PEZI|nr:hypothetical protein QBC35DRAFT_79453 [Podospora australis]